MYYTYKKKTYIHTVYHENTVRSQHFLLVLSFQNLKCIHACSLHRPLTFECVLHDLSTESCGDCGAGLHGGAAVDFNQPWVVVTADHKVSAIELK